MKILKSIACILFFASLLIQSNVANSQSPEKMSYQAVIRDGNNKLVVNSSVGMQISILVGSETGTSVYSETHTSNTNMNGLVTIEIGTGTTGDDFSAIDWSNGPYFIKTETDPTGGTNYTITGASQLLSVPFALHAKTAETVEETDPLFLSSVASEISAEDTTRWGTPEVFDEIDPIFQTSLAAEITADDTTRWGSSELPVAIQGNTVTFDGNNWIAADLVLTTNNTGSGIPINNIQPTLVLSYCISLVGIFPSRNSADPFLGEIQLFPYNFAPRNFAYCNGQLLAISSYSALFALLSTNYGGDGRTTFGLPDLRGRTPMHHGQGIGLSNRILGQRFGAETTTITIANLPAHKHTVNITYEE